MASVSISRTDMLAVIGHLETRYVMLKELAPESTLIANRARILGNLIVKLRRKLIETNNRHSQYGNMD